MRINEFTEVIDTNDLDRDGVKEGTLYFVKDGWRGLGTVAFLCPCGCGGFHMIPVYLKGEQKPDFCAWEIVREGDKITLGPSLLNGCKAHFFLRENKVVWC